MLSELGASQSGNSNLVSSSTGSHLSTGHRAEHLWKERKGAGTCSLVRTEETGPSLWLVKSHFGFTGFRCENMFRRTGNPDTFRRPNHREPSSTKNQETPVQNWL